MTTRLMTAALVYPIAQGVIFGTALVIALVADRDTASGGLMITLGLLSALLAAPAAWSIAPLLGLDPVAIGRRPGGGMRVTPAGPPAPTAPVVEKIMRDALRAAANRSAGPVAA